MQILVQSQVKEKETYNAINNATRFSYNIVKFNYNAFASPLVTTYNNIMKEQQFNLKLRPHHIIDIITDHGRNVQYEPHPYGHSQYIVAPKLLSNLDLNIKLVFEADDICTGCKHLMPDSKCNDVLAQIKPSPLKQAYNDVLDSRLFDYLAINPNCIMTAYKYLELINEKTPGIEKICTHPKEDMEERSAGLIKGLIKLGIRNVVYLKK
jgi:hypothetical protein